MYILYIYILLLKSLFIIFLSGGGGADLRGSKLA